MCWERLHQDMTHSRKAKVHQHVEPVDAGFVDYDGADEPFYLTPDHDNPIDRAVKAVQEKYPALAADMVRINTGFYTFRGQNIQMKEVRGKVLVQMDNLNWNRGAFGDLWRFARDQDEIRALLPPSENSQKVKAKAHSAATVSIHRKGPTLSGRDEMNIREQERRMRVWPYFGDTRVEGDETRNVDVDAQYYDHHPHHHHIHEAPVSSISKRTPSYPPDTYHHHQIQPMLEVDARLQGRETFAGTPTGPPPGSAPLSARPPARALSPRVVGPPVLSARGPKRAARRRPDGRLPSNSTTIPIGGEDWLPDQSLDQSLLSRSARSTRKPTPADVLQRNRVQGATARGSPTYAHVSEAATALDERVSRMERDLYDSGRA